MGINFNTNKAQTSSQPNIEKTNTRNPKEIDQKLLSRLINIIERVFFGIKSKNDLATNVDTVLKGFNKENAGKDVQNEKLQDRPKIEEHAHVNDSQAQPSNYGSIQIPPRPKSAARRTQEKDTKANFKESGHGPIQIPPRPQSAQRSQGKDAKANFKESEHGPIQIPPRPKIAEQRSINTQAKNAEPIKQENLHTSAPGSIPVSPLPEASKLVKTEIPQQHASGPIPVPPRPKIPEQQNRRSQDMGLNSLSRQNPTRERMVTLSNPQGEEDISEIAFQSLSIKTTPFVENPDLSSTAPPLPPRDEAQIAKQPPPLPPRDDEQFATPPAAPPPPPIFSESAPSSAPAAPPPPPIFKDSDLRSETRTSSPNAASSSEKPTKVASSPLESEAPEANYEVYGGVVINKAMLGQVANEAEDYVAPRGESSDEEWEAESPDDYSDVNIKKAKTTEDYLKEIDRNQEKEPIKETAQNQSQPQEEPNLFDAIRRRRERLKGKGNE